MKLTFKFFLRPMAELYQPKCLLIRVVRASVMVSRRIVCQTNTVQCDRFKKPNLAVISESPEIQKCFATSKAGVTVEALTECW